MYKYKYICFLFPFEYCLHFTFTNLMFLLIIDIKMAAHTCASGLFKLWNVDKWEYDEFKTLTQAKRACDRRNWSCES